MKDRKFRRPPVVHRTKRRSCQSSILFIRFRFGEVYLFHRTDSHCPSRSSLWGMFDKRIGDDIYLESSSNNKLRRFELWHKLPQGYDYCRLATREELSNFMFALAWFEAKTKR